MTVIPAVKALILRDGKILVLMRNNAAGTPDLPGGKIHRGEDKVTCLLREVKEETHLDVTVVRLLGKAAIPFSSLTIPATVYLCAASGTIRLSDEHKTYAWVPLKEIQESYPMWIRGIAQKV
ncbi:MAG: NUDIX domain-containing protein [Candidatus Aenigmarchaeota archaeon]|nr:NUDIX domain-containing protein [Candidatus Aenigmarchaeota archaeon]